MNFRQFEMRGVHTLTNRKRKKVFEGKTPEDAKRLALAEGFMEPLEFTELPFPEPSERQLAYAKGIGLQIPEGASSYDVSALLSRREDDDNRDPNPQLIEFADNRNIEFSNYIGKKALYNRVFDRLELRDKIAFFAFALYRYRSNDRHANLDTSPHKSLFYDFADQIVNNESFVKSLLKYSGEQLRFFGIRYFNGLEDRGGSDQTIAYKESFAYLKRNHLLEQQPFKTSKSSKIVSNTDKMYWTEMSANAQKLLIALVVLILIIAVLWLFYGE